MKSVKSKLAFTTYLDSLNDYKSSLHLRRQIVFYTLTIFGLIVSLVMAIHDAHFRGDTLTAGVRITLTFLGIVNIFYVHFTSKLKQGSRNLLLLLIFMYMLVLYLGTPETGGVLWFFMFPILAVSILHALEAVVWMIGLIALLIITVFLNNTALLSYNLTTSAEIIRIIIVLSSISFLVFLTDYVNHLLLSFISRKNKSEDNLHSTVQLEMAEKIQRSLIPSVDIISIGYDIAFYYQAAYGVGGDYMDCFTLDKDRIGLVMSDVAGKGIPAALMMVSLRTILRSIIAEGVNDPQEMIQLLNSMMRSDYGEDFYVTFAFILYNRQDNTIRFYNAGHSPFIYFSENEHTIKEVEIEAVPIGLFEHHEQNGFVTTKMFPGDIVLLFSDGLTDRINVKDNYKARNMIFSTIVENSSKSAVELKHIIYEKFVKDMGKEGVKDDISLIILKVK
jgi:hypothetical protein